MCFVTGFAAKAMPSPALNALAKRIGGRGVQDKKRILLPNFDWL